MSDESREAIQRQYSHGGAEYDRVRLEQPRGRWLTDYDVDLFERMLPAASQGAKALEVGAGTGRFTIPTLERQRHQPGPARSAESKTQWIRPGIRVHDRDPEHLRAGLSG
jgi:ubiquinone/menaquinone biosynthesis C-methylase UbiE